MPEKLTLKWLKEMISREISSMHETKSMLLESPYANIEEVQNDMGFSEMINLLNGKGGASSVVIMTPENPLGKQAEVDENDSRREKFEASLEQDGHDLHSMMGKYGVEENSYIIPNMSREEAVKYGQEYGQDSVIFGEKKNLEGGDAIEYQMIYTAKGTETDQDAGLRYVAISGEEADSRDNLVSEYNGEKFYIPFYENDYEGVYPWDLENQPESEEAQAPEVSVEP